MESISPIILLILTIPNITYGERWLGSIINEILIHLNPETTNGKCYEDLRNYDEYLKNDSVWAVKMADSTAASLTGILSGNTYHLGHFDQCISIDVPEMSIQGKYCVVEMRFWPNSTLYKNWTVFEEPSNFASVWTAFQDTKDPRIRRRNYLYLGICVPASCSSTVLQHSLMNQSLSRFHKKMVQVEFQTSDRYCTVQESQPKKYGFYIYVGIIIILLMLVTVGTSLQIYYENKKDYEGRWYYPFSIIFNTRRLLKDNSKELGPAAGMKVLSMFVVIYGHRFLLSLYAPVFNMSENEQRYGKFWETYILNGHIVVNTFFCTTGYLTFHGLLSAISEKKRISYLGVFLYRWIRVTAVYLLTIFFMVTSLEYVGYGPLWKAASQERSEVCSIYWWTHLLYVNNYISAEKLCLIPAWYLACDMQLFIIALFIGYIFEKNAKIGKLSLLGLLVISVLLIPGLVTFYGDYSGTVIFHIRNISNYHISRDYLNTYITTHFRLSPYVIGMSAAFLHNYLKGRGWRISFSNHVLLAFSTIFITGICLLGAWRFYLPEERINGLENAAYAVYSKLLWSINMCWIILANVTGGEELLTTKLLSSKIFIILNKLNLLVLLLHTPLQFILILSLRAPQHVTHSTTIWMASGDILLSYVLSFIIYLLVEAPISSFMKTYLL